LSGGASNVTGAVELAESVFQMPVRLGLPQNVRGLVDVRDNPGYATGVGLLLHGHRVLGGISPGIRFESGMNGLWHRMRSWFNGNF